MASKVGDPPSAPPLPAAKPRVFDIVRPGHAPANATSRPVIVGHGSHQADPLLAEKNATLPSFAAGEEYLAVTDHAPTGGDMPAGQTPASGPSSVAPRLPFSPAPPKPTDAAKPQLDSSADADVSMTIGEAATNALLADTVAPTLEPVVLSHHRPQRRVSWWSVVGVIAGLLIITLVTLDLLLDAQVVKTNLNVPHTHFIK